MYDISIFIVYLQSSLLCIMITLVHQDLPDTIFNGGGEQCR